MNGTDVLRRALEALRTDTDPNAAAHHDWIAGILAPVGRRQTTASEDEVREAIRWSAAYLGART